MPYLCKAVANRLSPRGAFLIVDDMASQHPVSRPAGDAHHAALFHHLVWLKHAGFAAVDCIWADEGRVVLAGFKQAAGSAAPLPAGS